MNKEQALHKFWGSFGIPAYDESTVPDDAKLPYLTYNVITSDFGQQITMNANIWYRSNSWESVTAKANEIGKAIGYGGIVIKHDDGAIWIKRGSSFAQRLSGTGERVVDTDKTLRRIVLTIDVEYQSI